MWKRKCKVLPLVLVFALLVNLAPLSAFTAKAEGGAEESGDFLPQEVPTNILELFDPNTEILAINDDDDLCSVTARVSDTIYQTKVFGYPVKYQKEDGSTDFIDTSIVSKGFRLFGIGTGGYGYTNKAGEIRTEFSENPEKGLRITHEGSQVGLSVAGASQQAAVTASIESAGIQTFASGTESTSETEDTSGATDAFVYDGAFGDGTAVKYYNTYTGVKEDILLYRNVGLNRFEFQIDGYGLEAVLSEDATYIDLIDPDNPGEAIYRLSPLYMTDSYVPTVGEEERSAPHVSWDCHYELAELEDGKYRVTAVVSEEFLNSPDTVYPVTIDPSIVATSTATNIEDTYVCEIPYDNTNPYKSSKLRIGNYNGVDNKNGMHVTLFRFVNLPTLPSDCVVYSANLIMKMLAGQVNEYTAAAWYNTKAWDAKITDWNRRPSAYKIAANVYPQNLSYFNYNVTEAVNLWHVGNPNYGLSLTYEHMEAPYLTAMCSSDMGTAGTMPTLTIQYGTTNNIREGFYYLRNVKNGKYLDLYGAVAQDGQRIATWGRTPANNQQWFISKEIRNGLFSIRSLVNTTYVLDVFNASCADGTEVKAYKDVDQMNQRFWLNRQSDGSYAIMAAHSSNGALGLLNPSDTGDNASVGVSAYTGQAHQRWILEEVPISKMVLSREVLTMYRGETTRVYPVIFPLSAMYQDITWSTNNVGVVSVDNDGNLCAENIGTAVITARTNGESSRSATCTVTVLEKNNDDEEGNLDWDISYDLSYEQLSTADYIDIILEDINRSPYEFVFGIARSAVNNAFWEIPDYLIGQFGVDPHFTSPAYYIGLTIGDAVGMSAGIYEIVQGLSIAAAGVTGGSAFAPATGGASLLAGIKLVGVGAVEIAVGAGTIVISSREMAEHLQLFFNAAQSLSSYTRAPRRPSASNDRLLDKTEPKPDGSIDYTMKADSGREYTITYSKEGFPDFTDYKHPVYNGEYEIELTGSRPKDFQLANAKIGVKETPTGYTWHHMENGKLILVETEVHHLFPHTGGFAIYK